MNGRLSNAALGSRALYPATLLIVSALIFAPATISADPCLILYPDTPTIYHYDVNEYYTVDSTHPLYDPFYDRAGEVLIEVNTNEIAYNIYQAPALMGFMPSSGGEEGYFIADILFNLIVDGFNESPTWYRNILLVFETIPPDCGSFFATVDGNNCEYDPMLGWCYAMGDLDVCTPTPHGNCFSDVLPCLVTWGGCEGFRVWAFADEDHDFHRDGGECFTAFSHDVVVPIEAGTWGRIKSLYRG